MCLHCRPCAEHRCRVRYSAPCHSFLCGHLLLCGHSFMLRSITSPSLTWDRISLISPLSGSELTSATVLLGPAQHSEHSMVRVQGGELACWEWCRAQASAMQLRPGGSSRSSSSSMTLPPRGHVILTRAAMREHSAMRNKVGKMDQASTHC